MAQRGYRRQATGIISLAMLLEISSCTLSDRPVARDFYAYYTRLQHIELPVIAPAREDDDADDADDAEENKEIVERSGLALPDDIPKEAIVVKIGDTAENFGGSFSGSIDDVSIYSTALEAEDVATLAKGKEILKDRLAYYSFDNNAKDSSQNARHAQLQGQARFSPEAKRGEYALELHGKGARVLTPIRETQQSFTWAAWIKTTSDGTVVANCAETGKWHPGGQALFIRDGRLVFDVGWVGDVEGGTNLTDGEWHHVAVTVDRNGATRTALFVDGQPSTEYREEGGETETPRRLTGPHADIVVRIANDGEVVFSRETSYLPTWKTATGSWPFPELVHREIDRGCLYSYARLIENKPEKILVHWRYMPDLEEVGFTGATHEYFEITPDGRVVRKIRQATEKLDNWNDPANVTIQVLKLKPDGIKSVSLKKATLRK